MVAPTAGMSDAAAAAVRRSEISGDSCFGTPAEFSPVFEALKASGVDEIMARLVYEVDWKEGKRVAIQVVTKVTRLQTEVLGYWPMAKVTMGVCRVSMNAIRLGVLLASIGASRGLGLAASSSMEGALVAASGMKEGLLDVVPLAIGTGVYFAGHLPPLELVVSKLKVSGPWETVKTTLAETAGEAFAADVEAYEGYTPLAGRVMTTVNHVYTLATDGASCLVEYVAWGDLAVGAVALASSPMLGPAAASYGTAAVVRGAVGLGAKPLVNYVQSWVDRLWDADPEEVTVGDYFGRQDAAFVADMGTVYKLTKASDAARDSSATLSSGRLPPAHGGAGEASPT